MSGAMIAVVEFSPVKNCFISLPASWAKDLSQVQFPTFQLEWGESFKAFVSWAGDITRHNDARDTEVIQINGLYGNKLGLVHGQEVLVQAVQSVLPCSQASVEPASFDDWEILELNASYVETNLLSQVRVIWPNQVLPVWIGKKICIFINISRIEPTEKCTRLEPYTELAIIPKTRTNTIPSNPQTPTVSSTDRGETLDQTPIDFNTKHVGGSSRVPANAETPSSLASIGESLTSGYVSDFGSTANIPLYRSLVDDTLENVDVDDEDYVKDIELDSSLPWAYRLWTYLKSFVSVEDSGECAIEQGKLSLDKERQKAIAKELLKDCNIVARIHALVDSYEHIEPSKNGPSNIRIDNDEINKNSYSHLMQPTTVYLSSDAEGALIDLPMDPSKPKNFSSHEDYVSFYAIITKLKSPKERQEEMRQRQDSNSTKNSKTVGEITSKVDDMLIDDAIKHTQKSAKWNDINKDYSAVRVVLNSQDIQTRQRSHSESSTLVVFDDASPWTLQISDLLRRQLKLELTAKVLIQPITEAPSLIESMTLCPLYRLQREITPAEIECAFQQWLTTVSCMIWPIPVCGGSSLLKFPLSGSDGEQEEFVLTINTEHENVETKQQKYFLLHPFIAKKVKFGVSKEAFCDISASIPPKTTRQIDHIVAGFRLRDLGGVTDLGQSGLNHIKTSLGIRPLSKLICSGLPGLMQGGMIITGPKGSGKSTLAMAVCREVMTWPQLVNVSVLECKPLKGKRVESVRRRFEEAFNEAAWRQPSLILLDDLDQLTGSPLGPEQEISPDALYSSRITEVLKDLMSAEIRQGTRLCVVATCLTRASLHQGLISSRGTHFFQHWIDIKPLDLRKREEMLISMIQSKMEVDLHSLDDLDIQCLASKCEGYVARDLMTVIERAIHAACSREMVNGIYNNNQVSSEENGITLIDEDFECALQNYTPATLRDVPLHNAGDLSWKNVGGLTDVKKVLLETLLWPAKYPQLFKNCPLRLRSGLLLYGPPGTGKTLLGGAVAKECGLNFISIKGPELLSKYIGASEQSVRDLFRRAQSAKPCILFFDEFDALAPRRGHDSTGVTDRVVNQLLTQLDGVEGLDGVYVIAATSRPDLIDPALLRPGRLDKCLNCPIPDKSDQLDILHALSLNMTLDDDVNFDNIIEHCEFFTGADLKALLYNAQLDAIHSQMTPLPKPLSSDRLSPLHMKTCRSMEADEWKLTFLDSVSFDDANPLNIENRTANNKSQLGKKSTSNDTDNDLNPVVENSSSDSDSASFVRLSQSEEEYNSNNGKTTPPGKHAPSLRDFAALKFERSPPLVEVADLETLGSMEDNAFYDLPSLYHERRQDQKLIYMPTLRDGIVDVTTETQERIANQVELIRKNHQDKLSGYSGLNKEDGSEAHESHVVKICQSNLLTAVNSMKPSVSAKERRRYQQIYDSFVNSRGGNFTGHDESSGKRATLA